MSPSSKEDHQKQTKHEEIELGAHLHLLNPEEHWLFLLRAAGYNRYSPTTNSTSRLYSGLQQFLSLGVFSFTHINWERDDGNFSVAPKI